MRDAITVLAALGVVIYLSYQWCRRDNDYLIDINSKNQSTRRVMHKGEYETFLPSHKSGGKWYETSHFGHDIVDNFKFIGSFFGHISTISDPLRTLSILEPLHAGTCSSWFPPLATVEETTQGRYCDIASNGGFYNILTRGCSGNIYSDGRLVQLARGTRFVNFGIRRDGSLVTGYLHEEDILDQYNPFVQLISGIGWLLRNGNIYLNRSKQAENTHPWEYWSMDHFFNTLSARVAIGHDQYGRVVIVHIDGKTRERGVSVYAFAKLLKELGLVNAINLDGGGSATLALNGNIINYPSDPCHRGSMFTCVRKVSTVLCIHAPDCSSSANCSGHGICQYGKCECNKEWTGPSCNISSGGKTESITEEFYMLHPLRSKNMLTIFAVTVSLAASLLLNCSLLVKFYRTSLEEG